MGKSASSVSAAWVTYGRRLSGLTTRSLKPGEAPFMALETNERIEFADFYKDFQRFPALS